MANQTATFNEDKVACLLGGILFVLFKKYDYDKNGGKIAE